MQASNLSPSNNIPLNLNQPRTSLRINVDLVIQHFRHLIPLTNSYQDEEGRALQLWKTLRYGLVGTVLDKSGNLQLIPGSRVHNSLQVDETPEAIIQRLENNPEKNWDIVFNIKRITLTLWPHLKAAGKNDGTQERTFRIAGSPVRYVSEERIRELVSLKSDYVQMSNGNFRIRERNYVQKDGNNWTDEKKGISIHIDHNEQGYEPGIHIDMMMEPDTWATSKEKRETIEARARDHKKEVLEKKNTPAREVRNAMHVYDKKQKEQEDAYTNLRKKWRFAYGERPPQDSPKDRGKGSESSTPRDKALMDKAPKSDPRDLKKESAPNNPGSKAFKQIVQQTGLTGTYNSSHKNNPVAAKGATGGEIGGVACSTEYIQGLFDNPEALFEHEHFFCFPQLADGRMPFSNDELRQILRELAIGIYVHSTVPFFSLHFREKNADLFPVVHPAYQNTLVGRVISILDYFMKGYLNGGVYTEKFIDAWHENPDWKSRSENSILSSLIDFERYCYENLEGDDRNYRSVRGLQQILSESEVEKLLRSALGDLGLTEEENKTLSNYDGFRNSFRIISKLKSIQQSGNVLMIEPDFDVFYDIEPSPEYKEALKQHERKKGEAPPSLNKLTFVYEIMKQRIHDHMVKMPLCRDYFAMLGVIHFFASYFTTLKQHRKIPVLPAFEAKRITGSPPLFPHLPIKSAPTTQHVQFNTYQVYQEILKTHQKELKTYFSNLFHHLFSLENVQGGSSSFQESEKIERLFKEKGTQVVLQHCDSLFLQLMHIQANMNKLEEICSNPSKQLFKEILEAFENQVIQFKNLLKTLSTQTEKIDIVKTAESISEKFLKSLSDNLPNEWQNILEKPIPYNPTVLPKQLSQTQLVENKRVVGGCGIRLEAKKTELTPQVDQIRRQNLSKLESLTLESWTRLDSEDNPQVAFRLFFEDVPAWLADDFHWMEALHFTSAKQDLDSLETRLKIEEALSRDDRETFSELIKTAKNIDELRDLHERSLLHHAAMKEDSFYVECLLKLRLSTSVKDRQGYLPIHYAAMSGHCSNLASLSRHHLNDKSNNGSTPLIVAIQHNHVSVVANLIKAGALPTLLAGGYTDLHSALHEGNLKIIDLLLEEEAFIKSCLNVSSEEGGTPLMLACELSSESLVRTMLQKGANPDAKRRDGVTAMVIAIKYRCLPVLDALIERSTPSSLAIAMACKKGSVEIIKRVAQFPNFATYKNDCKDTPLHIALRNGNLAGALYIAERFPLMNSKNIEEKAPISLAIALRAWEIVEILYNQQTQVDPLELIKISYHPLVKNIFDRSGWIRSAQEAFKYLQPALDAQNYEFIAKVLIPKGLQLNNFQSQSGWQILHFLAKGDALELFRPLIVTSDDLLHPITKDDNITLPYIAALNGSFRIFRLLVEQMKKRKISLEKHYKERHLFYAVVQGGNHSCFEFMLKAFHEEKLATIPLDKDNSAAIHIAAKNGDHDTLARLVENGADVEAIDDNQCTPLFYAVRAQDVSSITFLLEKNATVTGRALYSAARLEDQKCFKLLLNQKVTSKALAIAAFLAVRHHDLKAFSLLQEHNAPLDYISRTGWTCLLVASAEGQQEILAKILSTGLIDQTIVEDNNALHHAALNNHPGCISLLLDAGFKDSKNGKGLTAFEIGSGNAVIQAALKQKNKSRQELVQQFVNLLQGQDVDALISIARKFSPNGRISFNDHGKIVWGTAPQLILRSKNPKFLAVVSSLLQKESDPNLKDSNGNTLAHLFLEKGMLPPSMPGMDLKLRNDKGETPLHLAAKYAEAKVLKTLITRYGLQNPADLNSPERDGDTPLFYAIRAKKKENVEVLCRNGADSEHLNYTLMSPLALACDKGLLFIVRYLLEFGVNPNQRVTVDKQTVLQRSLNNSEIFLLLLLNGANPHLVSSRGDSPIHEAASKGKTSLVRLLSGQGISLDLQNKHGLQPKHLAAMRGKTETLKTILELQGGSVNTPLYLKSSEEEKTRFLGATPLHFAAMSGNTSTVEWLLSKYANPEIQTQDKKSPLTYAVHSPNPVDMLEPFATYKISQDPDYLLPAIIDAIQADRVDALSYLHNKGIPVDTNHAGNYTGLQIAIQSNALMCTQWFLQNGADPFLENVFKQNAFEIGAISKSYETFKLLLEFCEPAINLVNAQGQTLLHLSAKAGNLKHVMFLILWGINLNNRDIFGNTPLEIAAKEDNHSIVHLLLACGAETSQQIDEGMSPEILQILKDWKTAKKNAVEGDSRLHLAIRSGDSLAVYLLSQTDDVDSSNTRGETPLLLAVESGRIKNVHTLLQAGAAFDIPDHKQRTALSLACSLENQEIATLIKAKIVNNT